MSEKPKRMIGSVAKAISILDCFDDQKPEWNLTQLSKKLGIPKSTLLGTISTLEAANYLERTPNTNNYRLGLRLFELGHVVRSSMAIRQHAIPLMEEIHERTGAIVYLAIPRDGQVLFLEAVYPGRRLIHYSSAGRRGPMHCTGLGKAMLAYLPEQTVLEIVDYWGLPKYTEQTLTTVDALMADLALVRERGYALDRGEESSDVRCVAVSIRNTQGEVLGAMSISVSAPEFSEERIPVFAQMLMRATSILRTQSNLFPRGSFLPS